MSKNKPKDIIKVNPQDIENLVKKIKGKKPSPTRIFKCEHCQDRGVEQVYGPGPSLPCPFCAPKF